MEENFPFVLDHKNIFHIEQIFHLEYFQYIFAYFVDVILYIDLFLFLTKKKMIRILFIKYFYILISNLRVDEIYQVVI